MNKKLNARTHLLVSGLLILAALLLPACQAGDESVASAAAAAEPFNQEAVADRIRFQDSLAEGQSNAGGTALTTAPAEMTIADRIRFHDRLLEDNAVTMADRIRFHDSLLDKGIAAEAPAPSSLAGHIEFQDRLDAQADPKQASVWSMAERLQFQDRLADGP